MRRKKSKSIPARIAAALAIIVLVLLAIFLMGRYGWKLGGFRACQNAGISSVEVTEGSVHLTGFYPGSFPEGFCGCYAKEQDGKLYVGFRFSGIFGFFETGDFDVTIPVKGEIREVLMKTGSSEISIWSIDSEPVAEDTPEGEPAPEETPADTPVPQETPDSVPTPEESPTVPEAYATVIGEYYTVLNEDWDAARVMEQGLNYMVADSFFDATLEDIGYAVMDLDGDGREELVVGSLKEDEFFGKLIFSLYTLDSDGAPQLLIDSTERNRYYYAGGNLFANLGSSDWNESFVTTLKLEEGELIDMTYTTEPGDYVQMELTPMAQWVN